MYIHSVSYSNTDCRAGCRDVPIPHLDGSAALLCRHHGLGCNPVGQHSVCCVHHTGFPQGTNLLCASLHSLIGFARLSTYVSRFCAPRSIAQCLLHNAYAVISQHTGTRYKNLVNVDVLRVFQHDWLLWVQQHSSASSLTLSDSQTGVLTNQSCLSN